MQHSANQDRISTRASVCVKLTRFEALLFYDRINVHLQNTRVHREAKRQRQRVAANRIVSGR